MAPALSARQNLGRIEATASASARAFPSHPLWDSFCRWDSGWYDRVARRGYFLQEGQSDVAFFPAGSDATWRIPNHVRKIAILKSSLSQPMAFLLKAWIKLLELAGLSRDSGL